LVLGSTVLLAVLVLEAKDQVDTYVTVPGATYLVLGYVLASALASLGAAILKPAGRVSQFAALPLVTRVFWAGTLGAYAFGKHAFDTQKIMVLCFLTALPQLAVSAALVAKKVLPPAWPSEADGQRAVGFGFPFLLRQLGTQCFAYVNYATIKHVKG